MKKENYLPFDLETALKHPERVVTRDGRKVLELYCFKSEMVYKLVGVIENGCQTESWNTSGKYNVNQKNEATHDLFLLPEVKECWVNVYEYGNRILLGSTYSTKEYAIVDKHSEWHLIKTIRITNEPE